MSPAYLRFAVTTLLLVAGTLLSGCVDQTTTSVAYAPGYGRAAVVAPSSPGSSVPSGKTSVLGVYREGRMSAEAWEELAPEVSRALGSEECTAAFGGVWLEDGSPHEQQVDAAARSLGVSDEWVDRVAPAASGDLVLVLAEFRGAPSGPAPASVRPSKSGGLPALGALLSSLPKGKGALILLPVLPIVVLVALAADRPREHREPVDVTAFVFSRAAHRTIAAVHFHYVGPSEREARAIFASELSRSLPGLTCAGWDKT